jgi:hypothetical protein
VLWGGLCGLIESRVADGEPDQVTDRCAKNVKFLQVTIWAKVAGFPAVFRRFCGSGAALGTRPSLRSGQ